MAKKILFGAEYSILDPLALFYLSAVAKEEGFETKIVLSEGPEYKEFEKHIQDFNPDYFAATVYTGNHIGVRNFLNRMKKEKRNLTTIVGGPHPTYFPEEAANYFDFVVVGEGFDSLRRILKNKADKKIVHLKKLEKFPASDREEFYKQNPGHGENPIKNIITSTGCYFNCWHCYNSNDVSEVQGLEAPQIKEMKSVLCAERFFPYQKRSVEEVIKEIDYVQKIAPSTKMFFFEDDVFGGDIKWLEEFVEKYKKRAPFHANMRFELINPEKKKGKKRIDLLTDAGCTGLSLAIESGNETIREEILNRKTPEKLMFRGLAALNKKGIKARTYQMVGLSYGAKKKKTKINLEQDLETLKLNIQLREKTGLPTIAWSSTLMPYPGTKIANYCSEHGFYDASLDNVIGHETYRIRSVLKHPKKWVGPRLSRESTEWLDEEDEEIYRGQLNKLMNFFPIFALIPKGDLVAKNFLEKSEDGDIFKLMKKYRVFDKIVEGKELERKLKLLRKDQHLSKINATLRHHVYDNDLFKL